MSRARLLVFAFFINILSVAIYSEVEGNDLCDKGKGLALPVEMCSSANPCEDLLPTYPLLHPPIRIIDQQTFVPACKTGERGIRFGKGVYNDGAPKVWFDNKLKLNRYWCEFKPPGTSIIKKKPLVVFIHGSGGTAQGVYDATSLRGKASLFNLNGNIKNKGFILVSVNSRNLHWPTTGPQSGAKWDSYYRDFLNNPDVWYLDHVIDTVVKRGNVDPSRIYLIGWSNGARFSAFYGIMRHHQRTVGGNLVAAIANYSGGDPFENISLAQEPSCKSEYYPSSKLPLFMISRSCDAIACNEAQAAKFMESDASFIPGNVASTWIEDLKNKVGDPNVLWKKIGDKSEPTKLCAMPLFCSPARATLNHLHWIDGLDDGSKIDLEVDLLEFLSKYKI